MAKFLTFLMAQSFHCFHYLRKQDTENFATRLVADECVTVNDAVTIGNQIQNSVTGKTIAELSSKKPQLAVTFSVMK